MPEDPYYSVKEEIEAALTEASRLHTNLVRLVAKGGSGAEAGEIAWTRARLSEAVQTLSEDAADVRDAVKMGEANPAKFALSPADVRERREFVATVQRRVAEIRDVLAQPQAARGAAHGRAATAQANRDQLLSQSSRSAASATPHATPKTNDQFLDRENGMQQQIMQQQDQQLEGVAATVTTLKEVALVMNQELDDQTALLADLDVQVDQTQGKLDMGVKRLKDFIDANADTKQQWTICCLVVALVVLLVIIFSM
ncbi:syntaxin 6, N-terminal-domain-containing protein [Chytriomyces sp. MP71]|nr:syntaxin 6, N-terminal-domain-containing protein [Chytriomyces sp. MP71]